MGEMSGGDEDARTRERQVLLSNLLSAVKGCQIRYGGRSELATDSEPVVVQLCNAYEAVLSHGLVKKG